MTNAFLYLPLFLILHDSGIYYEREIILETIMQRLTAYYVYITLPVAISLSLVALAYKRDTSFSRLIRIIFAGVMVANFIALLQLGRRGQILFAILPLISIGIINEYLRKFEPDLYMQPIFQLPLSDTSRSGYDFETWIIERVKEIGVGWLFFFVNWWTYFFALRPVYLIG